MTQKDQPPETPAPTPEPEPATPGTDDYQKVLEEEYKDDAENFKEKWGIE